MVLRPRLFLGETTSCRRVVRCAEINNSPWGTSSRSFIDVILKSSLILILSCNVMKSYFFQYSVVAYSFHQQHAKHAMTKKWIMLNGRQSGGQCRVVVHHGATAGRFCSIYIWQRFAVVRHDTCSPGIRGGRSRLPLRRVSRADGTRHPVSPVHRGRPVQR